MSIRWNKEKRQWENMPVKMDSYKDALRQAETLCMQARRSLDSDVLGIPCEPNIATSMANILSAIKNLEFVLDAFEK